MLNNRQDYDVFRRLLVDRTRVQVPEFLQQAAAERLHQCLRDEVRWTLAERVSGTSRTLSADDYSALDDASRQAIFDSAHAAARNGFQFLYDSYMMVKAAVDGRDPDLLLHAVLGFLNSPEFLGFARWLTRDPSIAAVSAQATRYLPGHFLTRHEDVDPDEDRAFAYVINLSLRWDPDWGGLLQFHDDHGGIVQTMIPRWNALSLFKVPQAHSVSLVAPWAGEPRYAITGWLLRSPPVRRTEGKG